MLLKRGSTHLSVITEHEGKDASDSFVRETSIPNEALSSTHLGLYLNSYLFANGVVVDDDYKVEGRVFRTVLDRRGDIIKYAESLGYKKLTFTTARTHLLEQGITLESLNKYLTSKVLREKDPVFMKPKGDLDFYDKKLQTMVTYRADEEWVLDRIEYIETGGQCQLGHDLKFLFIAKSKSGEEIGFGETCINDFFMADKRVLGVVASSRTRYTNSLIRLAENLHLDLDRHDKEFYDRSVGYLMSGDVVSDLEKPLLEEFIQLGFLLPEDNLQAAFEYFVSIIKSDFKFKVLPSILSVYRTGLFANAVRGLGPYGFNVGKTLSTSKRRYTKHGFPLMPKDLTDYASLMTKSGASFKDLKNHGRLLDYNILLSNIENFQSYGIELTRPKTVYGDVYGIDYRGVSFKAVKQLGDVNPLFGLVVGKHGIIRGFDLVEKADVAMTMGGSSWGFILRILNDLTKSPNRISNVDKDVLVREFNISPYAIRSYGDAPNLQSKEDYIKHLVDTGMFTDLDSARIYIKNILASSDFFN